MKGKPIKIAYLMDHFAHPYGGTEKQALELIRRLDRRRFQPRVTLFRHSDYLSDNRFDCPTEVLGIDKMASLTSMRKLNRYARELRRGDVGLVHVFFNDASIVAPPILKWRGLRTVVSRRDMGFWYTSGNIHCLRANRMFVDRVIANSEAVKHHVCRTEHYSDAKVSVIYNGYDPAHEGSASMQGHVREHFGIPGNATIVGIVANLRAIKRIDDLIRAFAKIAPRHPNAWLVIVGTGELREPLETLAKSLDVDHRTVFTGQVAEPLQLTREFAVAVLCSESEGFSNSIIEYMSCAKPTVCTNVGGNPEIVREGESGFLVPAGNVDALADRIATLLTNPVLAERLGRNALTQAAERYGMAPMVEAHMSLYENLLARRPADEVAPPSRVPAQRDAEWR